MTMPQEKSVVEQVGQKQLVLKVGEARPQDVGRGIARLDPADMREIGVEPGDILRVKGKKNTVAKVMPAFPEDRGRRIVQTDGLIRDNAGVGLGEKVRLDKTECKPAKKIKLAPVTALRMTHREGDSRYIGRLLEGLVLTKGDRIRATFFASRSQDFTVIGTVPKGVVLVHPFTSVEIVKEEGGRNGRRGSLTRTSVGFTGKSARSGR